MSSILDSSNQFDRRISGVWGYSQFLQHPYYVIWCTSMAGWHHLIFAVVPLLNYSRGPLSAQWLLLLRPYRIAMSVSQLPTHEKEIPLQGSRLGIPASFKLSHRSNFSSFSPDPSTAWWIFFWYSDSPDLLLFSLCLIDLENLEYGLLF